MNRNLQVFVEMRCKSMEEVPGYVLKNLKEHSYEWWKDWAINYITAEYKEGYGAIQFVQFYSKRINKGNADSLKQTLKEGYDSAIEEIRKLLG